MSDFLLQTQNLSIGYSGQVLLKGLNLKLPPQIRLGIIGGNGSGKSTLVKTLLGILPPLAGNYEWAPHTHFGYVPQEQQLDRIFPLTVEDILKMGDFSSLFEKKSQEVLRLVELNHFQKKLFRELSGGERQRALIARALISEPEVLVMDEPHNSLDYTFREKIWRILKERAKHFIFSWLVIDHDLNRILNQIDWLCLLGRNQAFCGPVQEVLHEKTLSEAYEEPVHIHEENGRFQIHFL